MWHALRIQTSSIGVVHRSSLPYILSMVPFPKSPLRTFSTTSSSTTLKKLIQPFILKCHPDMAAQQGLPKTAVHVNLKAIQNLNSYIDAVAQLEKSYKHTFTNDQDVMEIEFVMAFASPPQAPAAAQPTTSRRKVELQLPSAQWRLPKVSNHVQRQVVKLLRMADLPIPKVELEEDDGDYDDTSSLSSSSQLDEAWMAGQVIRQEYRGRTGWDKSRERFLRRINWTKFDKAYQKALHDAQANLETRGMVRNNPKLRKQLLARILSHIQFTNGVEPLERLVAYRRLLRLFDEHFDDLELESFGKYWEDLQLVVTESRPYNTSSSALRKRRQRHMETGYQFTIHHDNSVTVQIPVDFHNEELIQELRRNVSDFYEWTQQDDALGLSGILDDDEESVMA